VLYVKTERGRYREAAESEIVSETSRSLGKLGMHAQSEYLGGIADLLKAQEARAVEVQSLLDQRRKERMLPGEKVEGRKGTEPA
jgi:hypothetical protein